MIKFKKMSTAAKVASGVGVTAVAGVALVPIINTFVDNPKSKVPSYTYKGIYYKNLEDAEAARSKFNAMSGLVKLMNGQKVAGKNIDYKPLMAEFVSFVSKLFVIKVFKMDEETATVSHFQYDGMSEKEKQELMKQQIAGQIKYGDLQDMTSLVKYATAEGSGNSWMFTPVDQMMLSILGDGSGQSYSQAELKYADISKAITKLKNTYNDVYKKTIKDNFEGISYSLVHGLVHHDDDELEMADHVRDNNVNEGDNSGDEYSLDLIRQFKEWGTLKTAFEQSKIKLDDYVSAENINAAVKPIYQEMVAKNAVTGWNNEERYSTNEINLRDLLIKLAAEKNQMDMSSVPGGDTSANVIQGWNWAPSGDQTDNVYEDWQFTLAKDMKERQRLMNLHLGVAPDGAVLNKNYAKTGDGTGNHYDADVFKLKEDFKDTDQLMSQLAETIKNYKLAGTTPAPANGKVGDTGIHVTADGLKDDIDHSPQWKIHEDWNQILSDITETQQIKKDFDTQLAQTLLDLTPGKTGADGKPDMSGFTLESQIIANILSATSKEGINYAPNFDQDQVDLAAAEEKAKDLQKQIDDLVNNGVVAAPPGAQTINNPGKGDQSNHNYDQKQIDLRDYQAQLASLGTQMATMKRQHIVQAPTGGKLSDSGVHQDRYGLGDGKFYTASFVKAVNLYTKYQASIDTLQTKIDAIKVKFPGFAAPASEGGKTFQQLRNDGAVEGENNGEQFTTDEVAYTADIETLEADQKLLATANDEITKLESSIKAGALGAAKIRTLQNDWNLRNSPQFVGTPELGINHFAKGDGTGATYGPDDVAYHESLKTLRDTFKKGNPWWDEAKSGKSKTSEEAYIALYNDWVHAVTVDKTLDTNSEMTGDGTDHKFDDAKFEVYERFFKDAFTDWHSGGNKASTIGKAMITITNYITKHKTLTTDGGFPGNTEVASTAALVVGTGDKSGTAYMDIEEGWQDYQAAFAKQADGSKSLAALAAKAEQKVADLQADIDHGGAAQYKLDAQAALDRMTTYITEHDPLVKAYQTAEDKYYGTAYTQGVKPKLEDMQKNLANTRAKLPKGISDADILALAALSSTDNQIGKHTQTEADELRELQGIDAVIQADQTAADQAAQAWTDAINKDHDKYIRWTKFTNPFRVKNGENPHFKGDGSGHYYNQGQIDERDIIKRIKAEIAKHKSTKAEQDAEFKIIMGMVPNSQVGPNTFDPTDKSKDLGDKSGNTYEQWEYDLYKLEGTKFADAQTAAGGDIAPEGAIFGLNAKVAGDGSGHKQDFQGSWDYFTNWLPGFNKLVLAKQNTADELAAKIARKAVLEGLGLSASANLDPTQNFETPTHKTYTMAQYKAAKEWASFNSQLAQLQTTASIAETAMNNAKTAKENYETTHDAQNGLDTQAYRDATAKAASLAPARIKRIQDAAKAATGAFDAAKDVLKKWWDLHKGQAIGGPGTAFENLVISNSFDDFISGDATIAGSMKVIQNTMSRKNAFLNGQVNVKPVLAHSDEDLKLRDALRTIVKFTGRDNLVHNDAKYATYAFNVLLMMYKNAASKDESLKTAASNDGYVSADVNGSTQKMRLRRNGQTFELYQSIIYGGTEQQRSGTMAGFMKWAYETFTPDTLKVNSPAKGNGKNEKYDANFFYEKGNQFKTEDDIKKSALGAAAFKVFDLHDKVQKFKPNSVAGENFKVSGDGSGMTYTQKDIEYYEKYRDRDKLKEDMAKIQKEIDVYKAKAAGGLLFKVPKGWTGTPVSSGPHINPLGDGSGNTYSPELIKAVNDYLSYQSQIDDLNQQIKDAKADFDSKASEADHGTWAQVTDTKYQGVQPGLNHDDLWTQEEIDYRGADETASDLEGKINGILATKIPDATQAGAGGSLAGAQQVGVTPAPVGAVVGWNAKATGTHDGNHYGADQIAKRDRLVILNTQLQTEQDAITRLTAVLAPQGVGAAPSSKSVVTPKANWHPVAIGDGTGNTYSKDIFEDIQEQQRLQDAVDAAIQAKKDFLADPLTSQVTVDTVEQEVANGMIDGVNHAEKYSTAEIDMRDKQAELDKAIEHYHNMGAGDVFNVYETLTAESIVGDNVKQVGIGNDQTYRQEQLDLRDIQEKIKQEELLHNIKDEYAKVHVNKFVYDGTQSKEDAAKPVDVELQSSVLDFYLAFDLNNAIIGANHASRGDATGAYYSDSAALAFGDIKQLQANIATDEAAIKDLQDVQKVKAAPLGAVAITADEAKAKGADPKFVGEHKDAVGDASGNVYKPGADSKVATAEQYVKLLEAYNKAKLDYETFVKVNPNEAKFFEFKTINGRVWNPIAGRNWIDASFEYKQQDVLRNGLKVGRTMVNLDANTNPSQFGTNRGGLQSLQDKDKTLVMYEGDKAHIRDEIVGSDRVRIGYVLNPHGQTIISHDAPVLSSLEAVAEYLQEHPELASADLIKKFAQLSGIKAGVDEEITKTTVSKDRFKTIEENYGIEGDK